MIGRAILVVGFAASSVACSTASHGGTSVAKPVPADTVIGTLQVTGTDAFPRPIIIPAMSGLPLRLLGPPVLRRVDGLQVQVVGKGEGDQFTVQSFLVVGANGQQATDGKLVQDAGTLYLVTEDGARHALVNPSPNLRAHVGARVWVSGSLDQEPIAYGIIQ